MRPWYVYVVWVVQVPAQAPEGLPPLWATALYDFVFSNDVSILLRLPAKCKTVFSGFYTAVPVPPGAAVFFPRHPVNLYSGRPRRLTLRISLILSSRVREHPRAARASPQGAVRALAGAQTGQGPQPAQRSGGGWGVASALPTSRRPEGTA